MGTEFATLATLATSLLIGLTRAYTVSGFSVANGANVAKLAEQAAPPPSRVPAERPGLIPFCEYWRESAEARFP